MMRRFLNMFRKKPKVTQLTKEEIEWQNAFTTVLQELAPGEVFELKAVPEAGGTTRFELHTESSRAMVVWAEIQAVLVPETPPKSS